jgi:hypothetical protein
MAEKNKPELAGEKSSEGQQAGQTQIRVRFDERNMKTSYANGFRTNSTPEEVIVDFGLNLMSPAPGQQNQPEMIFDVTERVIMNYPSAKRLAITLSQLIRRHEEQFGEVLLETPTRAKK